MIVKFHLAIAGALLLLLAASEPASGQLEAVGAVLSVVPVTSILATAGLVGVKLAALSRLLDLLGYDRAYLAQNLNTGTAATPIGLQTRYAYMFPYVPGLNISVKGDDSFGMPKEAINEMTDDGTKVSGPGEGVPKRKTYPSMQLPGDYEHQRKPFRGSGALKDIFQQAGIRVHVPTAAQQQQLQQQLNLPQKGNGPAQHSQQDNRLPPHPPPTDPNHNNHNNNYDPNRQQRPSTDKDNHQLVNKPSSLNSQQQSDQQQQSTSSSSSNSGRGQAADQAQVNMPHPDYSRDRHRHRPVQSLPDPPPPPAPPVPLAPPFLPVPPDNGAHDRGTGAEGDRHHQAPPFQSLSQAHYANHAVIPQRELLSAMLVREAAARRHQLVGADGGGGGGGGGGGQPSRHQVGPLTRPGLDIAEQPPVEHQGQEGRLRAVPLFPRAQLSARFSSAVPDSFKPQLHPEMHQFALEALARQRERDEHELRQFQQRQQLNNLAPLQPHPTIASQGPGFSPLPSNSNFYPPDFIPERVDPSGASPTTTTTGDTADDEFNMTPRFKRAAIAAAAPLLPNPILVDAPPAASQQQAQQQQQQASRPQTFGMPAVNINTLRRRRRKRRQAGGEPSLLASKLLPAAARRELGTRN